MGMLYSRAPEAFVIVNSWECRISSRVFSLISQPSFYVSISDDYRVSGSR